MARRKTAAAPTTVDDFVRWVVGTVPDGCEVYVHGNWHHRASAGTIYAHFQLYVELTNSVTRKNVQMQSHDFGAIARWLMHEAIPTLYPSPEPPRRKIYVQRPKLEYKPAEPLFG